MITKFKVGDRVRKIAERFDGFKGTVVLVRENGWPTVEFDKYGYGMRDCGGKGPSGRRWMCHPNNLEHTDDTIEELELVISEATAKLEELRKAEASVWPASGDKYWWTTERGAVDSSWWNHNGADVAHLAIGNVFRTREDAERHVENLKTLAILRKHAGYYIPCISEDRWSIYQCSSNGDIDVTLNAPITFGAVYFPTKQAALHAIDEVGEDAIKRLMGLLP